MDFEFSAGYEFGQTFDVIDEEAGLYTRSGHLTGSWQWRFADGRKGNTHLNSSLSLRVHPFAMIGTMRFDMGEFEGTALGQDLLYLAYEGVARDPHTNALTSEGTFVGGRGKYTGATGSVHLVSINGFIEKGTGTLILQS